MTSSTNRTTNILGATQIVVGDNGVMELAPNLKPYFHDEHLVTLPRRRAPRLAVLDLLANQFEPGYHYDETYVNQVLVRFHADFCALRRYLVDEHFLERQDGVYWRIGGSVDVR